MRQGHHTDRVHGLHHSQTVTSPASIDITVVTTRTLTNVQVGEMASEQSHQVHSHEARFFGEASNLFFITEIVVVTCISFLHLDHIHVLLLDVHVVIINSDSTAKL